MKLLYTLNGREPVPVDDPVDWAMWRAANPDAGRVAWTEHGSITISTVFLGVDHSFAMHGPPVLYETMIFGEPFDRRMYRYCTWDEA